MREAHEAGRLCRLCRKDRRAGLRGPGFGREFGQAENGKGIAVHCLEPGTVDNSMTRELMATFGGLKEGHVERMVSPEEVAEDL